ncbi:hypothetical protein ACFQFG_18555 [Methylobacterium persicinum]
MLRADRARNVLILNGDAGQIRTLRQTIEVFDVDWMRGMSTAMLPVRSSNPRAIARDLTQIFGGETAGTGDVIRFVPNEALSAVLVVTSRAVYLDRARVWLAELETLAADRERQLFVYRIQNRSAKELAAVLQGVVAAETGINVNVSSSAGFGGAQGAGFGGAQGAGFGGLKAPAWAPDSEPARIPPAWDRASGRGRASAHPGSGAMRRGLGPASRAGREASPPRAPSAEEPRAPGLARAQVEWERDPAGLPGWGHRSWAPATAGATAAGAACPEGTGPREVTARATARTSAGISSASSPTRSTTASSFRPPATSTTRSCASSGASTRCRPRCSWRPSSPR